MKIHLIFFLYIIVHICVACAPDMVVSSPDEQNSISLSLDSQGVLNYQIKSGDDLVWYGRVETERHYKGDDPEVEAGRAKAGDRKPGLQLHVHIIVSRMDRSQTVSLSPLSKSRGNRQVLDGMEVVVGFARSPWSARCASRFNRLYGYFPYCRSKDEGLKEYSGEWKARNELRNETVSRIMHIT